MKISLMNDVFRLAFTKKNFFEKSLYLLRGIVFFPILIGEERSRKGKNNNTSDVGLAGDDVYPLF